ncbi:hypothetical protein [Roseomonas indoligenes]|uniref:Uncharacterized protein n=1 Tax=Roseomonas indoligenes TaxID=2820811 RepID=A0A940N175_9PROT|nr:hypothetical protein [Pararoseomonas indoligenes]MBP0494897.1 hypothetical protein [Pararoseomonas indoligenes]
MPESRHAPPDLDVLAARRAARLFRSAVARGVPEGVAWADAVEVFRFYHPAWPLPMVEREAARVVAALIEREDVDVIARAGAGIARGAPPARLLRELCRPVVPLREEPEVSAPATRDGWRAYAGLLNPPGLPRLARCEVGAG